MDLIISIGSDVESPLHWIGGIAVWSKNHPDISRSVRPTKMWRDKILHAQAGNQGLAARY